MVAIEVRASAAALVALIDRRVRFRADSADVGTWSKADTNPQNNCLGQCDPLAGAAMDAMRPA
jgi:hypothetical protein